MQQTPFFDFHRKHGAKFVDFAGWEMPIMYRSIHQEHRQVRSGGGFFDVSHMGRIRISGRHARRLLERALTRQIGDQPLHRCRYALICNERGGVLDDVIVYRFEDHWLLVVNASNRKKVVEHLNANLSGFSATIEDQTLATAMIAIQGPEVMPLIGRFSTEVPALKRYSFCIKNLLIVKMTISRTGYTGEDGVEVILPANRAEMVVKLFLRDRDDESQALTPAGLGARDTLRMESAMPLYGHELDEDTDPLAAGLGFAVNLEKDQANGGQPFIGQAALQKIAREGPKKKLIGLKLDGKRTARQNMAIFKGVREVGRITSGCVSPTLGYPIAMAFADRETCTVGDVLEVELGAKRVAAEIVALPFYQRKIN